MRQLNSQVDVRPLVSILLPVYNCEAFVATALASLTEQSYQNLEIIIVDDGSTDGTPCILSELAHADARIRVLRTENNGLVAALNLAIAEATGTLLARMDGDDIAEVARIQKQVAHMEKHPECVAVGCRATKIDIRGRPIGRPAKIDNSVELPDRCQSFRRFPPAPPTLIHPSAMIRASTLEDVGGYRHYFEFGAEDRDLWWRLSRVGAIHCLPDQLLRYRVHPANRSQVLRERSTADMLICDLSAVCRFHDVDDTAILEAYTVDHDVPAATAAYEALVGSRYPVWALHAYRVLRRRAWSLSGSPSPLAFRARSLQRAAKSLSSRPAWSVLGSALR